LKLPPLVYNILLADDDKDDHYFFARALKALPIPTDLVTVEDGEKLMTYLTENSEQLPNVLFLDLNMPRKNGSECLSEIKLNKKFKQLPVIIYSTSLYKEVADELYKKGASYYIRKTGGPLENLQKILYRAITLVVEKKIAQPTREEFVLGAD
jgi:CheY-like chemotaxis protein